MTRSPSDLNDLAQTAAEMVMTTQTASLRLLEAELHALAHMMPGVESGLQEALPTDEEIEQAFDNMPV